MPSLPELTAFCDALTGAPGFPDFPGAHNGLQMENRGRVTRLGAAVDASLASFQAAAAAGIDFLIVHHGLFWSPLVPLTGPRLEKLQTALDAGLAVYSCHLPLDAHPHIGNNVLLARALGLRPDGAFLPYEGRDIGLLAEVPPPGFPALRARLQALFPDTFTALEFGSPDPRRVALCTGSGATAVERLPHGIDTLITGELRQHHFVLAQELRLNLFPCGHYATETFGVQALAAAAAAHFNLPWLFLPSPCPL